MRRIRNHTPGGSVASTHMGDPLPPTMATGAAFQQGTPLRSGLNSLGIFRQDDGSTS